MKELAALGAAAFIAAAGALWFMTKPALVTGASEAAAGKLSSAHLQTCSGEWSLAGSVDERSDIRELTHTWSQSNLLMRWRSLIRVVEGSGSS
jgi:hypothetical protein